MQSSRNNIRMFCLIQTHRHIGMSSINFHINHSMHSNCYDIYIYIYIYNKHTCISSITSHINHNMQSSHNDIRMFCFIQTHRHIGTSSINFYINHSMHSNCYYIYIYIERERERERELCMDSSIPFKHIHTGTFSHENHHKTCHTSLSCYACFSFIFLPILVSWGTQPNGLSFRSA